MDVREREKGDHIIFNKEMSLLQNYKTKTNEFFDAESLHLRRWESPKCFIQDHPREDTQKMIQKTTSVKKFI